MGANIFCAVHLAAAGTDASITVSIGLSRTGPVDFNEPDILLQMAGTRMYEEKAQHHNGPRRNDTASSA